ncbi:hypothetical protein AALO_G00235880 [Alosa alosa]|uniref:SPRY-associated domain-containing protein n=1 Tax=Alosa alosa TaxID=278164 RepID=A0AAV6FZQ8_9TELE|nr:hypothetical protein AALO_G00235880 [Alosa alosa]
MDQPGHRGHVGTISKLSPSERGDHEAHGPGQTQRSVSPAPSDLPPIFGGEDADANQRLKAEPAHPHSEEYAEAGTACGVEGHTKRPVSPAPSFQSIELPPFLGGEASTSDEKLRTVPTTYVQVAPLDEAQLNMNCPLLCGKAGVCLHWKEDILQRVKTDHKASMKKRNFKALKSLLTGWERQHFLETLLKDAVDKSLESEDGHWDLFVRFLLGLSLESNQRLLQGLLTQTVSSSESIEKTIKYTKEIIRYKDIKERCMNLLLCLLEMNDNSLHTEIQEYLESGKELFSSHCSVLAYTILVSEDVLDELDLQKYTTTSEGRGRLLGAVSGCRKARLIGCRLTSKFLKTVTSALQSETSQLRHLNLSYNDLKDLQNELLNAIKSEHCKLETLMLNCCELKEDFCGFISSLLKSEHTCLKELDLSNNDLCDAGVEQLSNGLMSPNCKVEVLMLSGCLVSERGFEVLASVLESNHSNLRELDLSYNHPSETAVSHISSLEQNKGYKLTSLNVEHGGELRLKAGLRKYACELTMDPNTPHKDIALSKKDTKAKRGIMQLYPPHEERFEVFEQVLCREGLTGRRYWEAEWGHKGAAIAVAYRGIERKGKVDSEFGSNDKSWSLMCCDNVYIVKHNAENINKAKAQPTELTETSCFGQRSVSPVPSLLSMKSSDSMMQPINMDGGTGHSDHRSVSPVPSLLSMKSSDSMMQPINLDGGTGHDHRSVSPVPSLLSLKSSDSMMQPINVDGGTGHSNHRQRFDPAGSSSGKWWTHLMKGCRPYNQLTYHVMSTGLDHLHPHTQFSQITTCILVPSDQRTISWKE